MSDIEKLKKLLADHEKRIHTLENPERKEKIPQTEKRDRVTILGLFKELKGEGFFDKPKSRKEILMKLEELGHIYEGKSIDSPIIKALRQRILGRKKIDGKWGYVKR